MAVTLELRGLQAGYGRHSVLRDVNTPEMRGGEITAVIGPNAVGKSTLFRRIAGLIKGAGEVRVDGKPDRDWNASGIERPCYMPQDTQVNAVLTVLNRSCSRASGRERATSGAGASPMRISTRSPRCSSS